VVPAESTAAIFRAQRMNSDISIWSRGVDRDQFSPAQRSVEWRRQRGIADDDMVVAFLGRLVLEKGLEVFADTIEAARAKDGPLKVLAIGDGPAREYFKQRLPDAIFTGQLTGVELATALASADVLFNPSVTEAFGNVTLEAMACGLPVVAAVATGATSLVKDGITGLLAIPGDIDGYADALATYQRDPTLRARHGDAGLAFAMTMDWDDINAVVEHVYERVIERRRRQR
jgi:glycosyltransferase involved in cell wall biosynthesis